MVLFFRLTVFLFLFLEPRICLALSEPPPSHDSEDGLALKTECFKETSPKNKKINQKTKKSRNAGFDWNWCMTQAPSSKNKDILFLFHGLGGNEEFWLKSPESRLVYDYWFKTGFDPPAVVSISMGKFWILASKNTSPESGRLDFFRDTILPFLIQKLHQWNGNHYLAGFSMGGFNASQILLHKIGRFKKIAMLCPAITDISPFASRDEVNDFITRNNAWSILVEKSIELGRRVFPKKKDWDTADPLALAETRLSHRDPQLHITCGRRDEFGFHDSVEKFVDIALESDVSVDWISMSGGHCAFDAEELAAFFSDYVKRDPLDIYLLKSHL